MCMRSSQKLSEPGVAKCSLEGSRELGVNTDMKS